MSRVPTSIGLTPTTDSLTTADRAVETLRPADEKIETDAERRNGLRRPLRMNASLIPLGGADAIYCTSDNVGEDGMHVTVPVGYGLAVGQRYELVLASPDPGCGDTRLITGEGHYATVVRTELRIGDGEDRVGVGIRFDQPLVL